MSDTESTPQELVSFMQFANSCTKQSKLWRKKSMKYEEKLRRIYVINSPLLFMTIFQPTLVNCQQQSKLKDQGGGGGATRPIPRDGGAEEILGDQTVRPRPKAWTRDQTTSHRCIVVVKSPPLYQEVGRKEFAYREAGIVPEGFEHPVVPQSS